MFCSGKSQGNRKIKTDAFCFAFLFILALAVVACNNQDAKNNGEKVETSTAGEATILCDEAVYDLMAPVFGMYDSAYPNASITVQPLPARAAMGQLLAGDARGIISARPYLRDEDSLMKLAGVDPHASLLIARDALVFFSKPEFPISALDHDDLARELLSEENTLKEEFPELTRKPVLACPNVQSSEYANLQRLVTAGKNIAGRMVFAGTRDSVKKLVSSGEAHIGVGYLSQLANDTSFKMLRVGFIDSTGTYIYPKQVHQTTIVANMYPYPIEIRGLLLQEMRNLPWGFMIYLARDNQAQLYYKDAGIVPGYAKFRLVVPE